MRLGAAEPLLREDDVEDRGEAAIVSSCSVAAARMVETKACESSENYFMCVYVCVISV